MTYRWGGGVGPNGVPEGKRGVTVEGKGWVVAEGNVEGGRRSWWMKKKKKKEEAMYEMRREGGGKKNEKPTSERNGRGEKKSQQSRGRQRVK